MLDGADCNRQFIKIHFKGKDPVESKFMAKNLYTGEPMIFIMDPKVILCVIISLFIQTSLIKTLVIIRHIVIRTITNCARNLLFNISPLAWDNAGRISLAFIFPYGPPCPGGVLPYIR